MNMRGKVLTSLVAIITTAMLGCDNTINQTEMEYQGYSVTVVEKVDGLSKKDYLTIAIDDPDDINPDFYSIWAKLGPSPSSKWIKVLDEKSIPIGILDDDHIKIGNRELINHVDGLVTDIVSRYTQGQN